MFQKAEKIAHCNRFFLEMIMFFITYYTNSHNVILYSIYYLFHAFENKVVKTDIEIIVKTMYVTMHENTIKIHKRITYKSNIAFKRNY